MLLAMELIKLESWLLLEFELLELLVLLLLELLALLELLVLVA